MLFTEDEKLKIFKEHHSGPLGGHNGVVRTQHSIAERYFWPGVGADIADQVFVLINS